MKLFTVNEATALIPIVSRHVQELQTASCEIQRLRTQLKRVSQHSLTARNCIAELTFLVGLAQHEKAALDRLGVQLEDLSAGSVTFPGQVGNELVWLHWEPGQQAITHYYTLTDPTAQRPLPS